METQTLGQQGPAASANPVQPKTPEAEKMDALAAQVAELKTFINTLLIPGLNRQGDLISGIAREQREPSGLDRFFNHMDAERDHLRREIDRLSGLLEESEKNRKHVLSLLNYIRSSAYSLPTAPNEPNFQTTLEEKLRAQHPHPEIGPIDKQSTYGGDPDYQRINPASDHEYAVSQVIEQHENLV